MNVIKKCLLSIMVGTTMSAAYAEIYQTKNKQGVTVFTDRPDQVADHSAAEVTKVDVAPVSTVPAYSPARYGPEVEGINQFEMGEHVSEKAPDEPLMSERERQQVKQVANTNYKLKLVSPLPEATYRRGVGDVNVSVAMSPSLQQGHAVVLEVDGQRIANATSGKYPTVNLHRGDHTATAKVVDAYGKTLTQQSVTFFVHQPSKIIRDKRKAAQEKKKRDSLPWWKRIKIKL